MIILFSTLYVLEPDIVLTPALSFSCVSLLYMTDLSMNGCGQALRNFSQVMNSSSLLVCTGLNLERRSLGTERKSLKYTAGIATSHQK